MNHSNTDAARKARIKRLGVDIADRMDSISRLFKSPVKLTLIIRDPDFADGTRDTIQTNDEWSLAKAAAERLLSKTDNEIYIPADTHTQL